MEKTLIIMRGVSGSGKSTLAKELAGETGVVYSTDDFFIKNGEYQFDGKKLHWAHKWNFARALTALREGVSPIVIDNTNTQAWEPQNYVKAAKEFGYEVEIREPDTSWKYDAEELANRNTHGVPLDKIKAMLARWEPNITVDDILNAVPPRR